MAAARLAVGARLRRARARARARFVPCSQTPEPTCSRPVGEPGNLDSLYVYDPDPDRSERGDPAPAGQGRAARRTRRAAAGSRGRGGPDPRTARGAGDRGRRRHGLARRLDPPRRSLLPHERRRDRGASPAAAGGRCARVRPSACARSSRGAAPPFAHQPDLTATRGRLPVAPARTAGGASRRTRESASSTSPRKSSRRWGRTSSDSTTGHERSHSTATTSRDGAWRRSGVEVLVYKGDEISRKGDGGPTCLTLPLVG